MARGCATIYHGGPSEDLLPRTSINARASHHFHVWAGFHLLWLPDICKTLAVRAQRYCSREKGSNLGWIRRTSPSDLGLSLVQCMGRSCERQIGGKALRQELRDHAMILLAVIHSLTGIYILTPTPLSSVVHEARRCVVPERNHGISLVMNITAVNRILSS